MPVSDLGTAGGIVLKESVWFRSGKDVLDVAGFRSECIGVHLVKIVDSLGFLQIAVVIELGKALGCLS